MKGWLTCGYNYNEFWDLSIAEINFIIENYSSVAKKRNREIYEQAVLIAEFIGSGLAGKRIRSFDEIYNHSEKEEAYVDDAYLKELWLDYAEQWNKKRKGGK